MGQPSSDITTSKAKEVLRDGTIRGKPLTPAQRGMFGAAAGRGNKMGGMTGLSYRARGGRNAKRNVPGYARGGTVPLNRRGKSENMTNGQTLASQEKSDSKVSRYKGDGVGAPYKTTPRKGVDSVRSDTPAQSSRTKVETNPKGPGKREKSSTPSVTKKNTRSGKELRTAGRNDSRSERGGDKTQGRNPSREATRTGSSELYTDPMASFGAPGAGGFVDHDDVGSAPVGLAFGGNVGVSQHPRARNGVSGRQRVAPANTDVIRGGPAAPVRQDTPINTSPAAVSPQPAYPPPPMGAGPGGSFPGMAYGGYVDGGLLRQMLMGGQMPSGGFRNGGMVSTIGPSSGSRGSADPGSGFALDGGVAGAGGLDDTVNTDDPLTRAMVATHPHPMQSRPLVRGGGTSMTQDGRPLGSRTKSGGGGAQRGSNSGGTATSGGGAGADARKRKERGANQPGHGIPGFKDGGKITLKVKGTPAFVKSAAKKVVNTDDVPGFKTGGKMGLPAGGPRTQEGDEVGKLGAQGSRPNVHRGDLPKKIDSVQHGSDQQNADKIRDEDMSSGRGGTSGGGPRVTRPSGMLEGYKRGGNVALIRRLAAARKARRK